MQFKLKAQKRELFGKKVKKLRKQGLVPAIIYGHKFKNIPLKLNLHDFVKIFERAKENMIIDLEIEGDRTYSVLVHDILKDPVSGQILHIDFYRIKAGEEITAEIPLVFQNISPAVKDLGGTLVTNIRTIKVRALPKDLPHDIKLDISTLKSFDDQIKVSDLPKPQGVKFLMEPEAVVVLIKPPRTQAETEALSEEVKEEVSEVEGVGDKEEDIEKETGEEEASEEKGSNERGE